MSRCRAWAADLTSISPASADRRSSTSGPPTADRVAARRRSSSERTQKLGDQLEVIGIDYQEPQPGKAIAFADELGLTYPDAVRPACADSSRT